MRSRLPRSPCLELTPRILAVVCVVLFWILAGLQPVQAQAPSVRPEEGLPFTRVIGRFQFTHGSLVKDSTGRVYFNGTGGVHCFDGHAWSTIPVPGSVEIRSLAVDSGDRIWLGGHNELGCLQPEPDGSHSYRSLMPLLSENERDYGLIYNVHVLGADVYFAASTRIFRLRDGKMKMWEIPSTRRLFSSTFDGRTLYVHSRAKLGLFRFSVGEEEPQLFVPDSKLQAVLGAGGLMSILPGEADTLVLGTAAGGVGLLKGSGEVVRSNWPLHELLIQVQIECGIPLSDGSLALGTLREGVIIISRDGTPLRRLRKAQGLLLDDTVVALLEISPGRLWVASKLGITECDLRPGLSRFDEHNGAGPDPLALIRSSGTLWLGADSDLLRLKPASRWDETAAFISSGLHKNYFRALVSWEKGLLALALDGLVTVPPSGDVSGTSGFRWQSFDAVRGGDDLIQWGPQRLLLAVGSQLISAQYKGGVWREHVRAPLPSMRQLLPDPAAPDSCLVLSKAENISRILPLGTEDQPPQLLYEGGRNGPVLHWFQSLGCTFVYTATSVWRLEPGGDNFERQEANDMVRRVWASAGRGADESGWMITKLASAEAPQTDLSVFVLRRAVRDLRIGWRETGPVLAYLHGLGVVREAYVDEQEVLWIAGAACILRVDTKVAAAQSGEGPPRPEWKAVLQGRGRMALAPGTPPKLPDTPGLEFFWCQPLWEGGGSCLFQTRLLGEDPEWGPPQVESLKSFQRLAPGSYRFEVRALNLLGIPGRTLAYDFVIMPRWYQTWWVRSAAFLCCCLPVFGLVKWRTFRLRQRQQELELTVARRTRELLATNAMLHQVTEAKTDFVRTVSHELRTPLAGAHLMSELLLRTPLEQRQRDQAQKLQGCVSYLQRLLDNTLDYSRLEAGQVPCELSRFELYPLLRDTAALFESLAERKGLAYELDFPGSEGLWCQAESTHLQRVLVNFLSNAFKFTHSGRVSFRAFPLETTRRVPYWRMEISDTGRGVDPAVRSRLFSPFVRNTSLRGDTGEQGAGLGLALCKRLAILSGAKIGHAEPAAGGSCFWVEWPLLPASPDPEEPSSEELDFGGIRMLVVEDDKVQREALAQLLLQLGVQLSLASTCDEAEQLLCAQAFDLALVDYNLGAQTALNVLERCKLVDFGGQRPPCFHLMTAQDLDDVITASAAAGFTSFQAKPLSLSHLYALLAEQLSVSK